MAGGCPGHASLCHFTSQAGEGKPIQHPGELWAEMDEGLCPSSCSLTLKCSLMRQLESDPLMGQIKDYLAKHLGINWYQSKDSPAESPGAEATVRDCCPWTSAAPMVAPGLGTSAQGGLRGPCDPHGGSPSVTAPTGPSQPFLQELLMLQMGTWIFAPSSAWRRLGWSWPPVPLPHIHVCLTNEHTQPAPGLFQKQLPHVEAIEHVISQPDTESLPPPEGEELCRSQPGFSRKGFILSPRTWCPSRTLPRRWDCQGTMQEARCTLQRRKAFKTSDLSGF